jgi:hypothetical protein
MLGADAAIHVVQGAGWLPRTDIEHLGVVKVATRLIGDIEHGAAVEPLIREQERTLYRHGYAPNWVGTSAPTLTGCFSSPFADAPVPTLPTAR